MMLKTIDAFYNFLQANNIPTKGVSVTIEFDDMGAAARAKSCMKQEFAASIEYFDPVKHPEIVAPRIMNVPVKIVAKV